MTPQSKLEISAQRQLPLRPAFPVLLWWRLQLLYNLDLSPQRLWSLLL